ncbi:MAG TPA: ANTAR domain-containing protein [Gemmataceae bacterium]|jgi:response regulator NasT|nr:ANTAR domain-containing protein [Gemmataceae bacterium]
MSQALRIAVGDVERETREFLERRLPRLGHTVVSVAETGRDLVEHCRLHRPDLVVVGVRQPWAEGLRAVANLFLDREVPVIACTERADEGWAEQAFAAGVFAHLFKPVTEREVGPAIDAAWLRWQQFQTLWQEAADLKQALEDRKVVERAKGAVMRRVGVQEYEAFRRLRKMASDGNLKLVEVARRVLAAEDTFRALDAL